MFPYRYQEVVPGINHITNWKGSGSGIDIRIKVKKFKAGTNPWK